ncbi:MAG: PAC2 family protein [Anaerolineae bacterium]
MNMDAFIQLAEKPLADEIYMLAGWRQWADAGAISSELPRYVIDQTHARKIGELQSDPFYLFQFPGTHHLLRPEIKLVEGHLEGLESPRNEIYYAGDDKKGLLIFLGDEPHLNIARYAEAFFNLVMEMRVKRVSAVGGVYGAVPYDKDRQLSCIYSLPRMKHELTEYAVGFSNYQGGATIGSYLSDRAERLDIEYLGLYGFVPMYDFSQLASNLKGLMIEQDYKAWYDILTRLNHMFNLGLDLAELEQDGRELTNSIAAQLEALQAQAPQAQIQEYLEQVNESFEETSYLPLDDAWKKGLDDIL